MAGDAVQGGGTVMPRALFLGTLDLLPLGVRGELESLLLDLAARSHGFAHGLVLLHVLGQGVAGHGNAVTPDPFGEKAFRALWDDNWDARLYEKYNDILLYARQERIPLVGLNIPRGLVTQVARGGFGSLSEGQRRELGVDSCDVSGRYVDILRRVTGEKELGAAAFNNFCEAQIVWDAARHGKAAHSAARTQRCIEHSLPWRVNDSRFGGAAKSPTGRLAPTNPGL